MFKVKDWNNDTFKVELITSEFVCFSVEDTTNSDEPIKFDMTHDDARRLADFINEQLRYDACEE